MLISIIRSLEQLINQSIHSFNRPTKQAIGQSDGQSVATAPDDRDLAHSSDCRRQVVRAVSGESSTRIDLLGRASSPFEHHEMLSADSR